MCSDATRLACYIVVMLFFGVMCSILIALSIYQGLGKTTVGTQDERDTSEDIRLLISAVAGSILGSIVACFILFAIELLLQSDNLTTRNGFHGVRQKQLKNEWDDGDHDGSKNLPRFGSE